MKPACAKCGGTFSREEWEERHSNDEEELHAECCGLEVCKAVHAPVAPSMWEEMARAVDRNFSRSSGISINQRSFRGAVLGTTTQPGSFSVLFGGPPAQELVKIVEGRPQEQNPRKEVPVLRPADAIIDWEGYNYRALRDGFQAGAGFRDGERRTVVIPGYEEYGARFSDRVSSWCSAGLHARCAGERMYETSDGPLTCRCPHHSGYEVQVQVDDESNYT